MESFAFPGKIDEIDYVLIDELLTYVLDTRSQARYFKHSQL